MVPQEVVLFLTLEVVLFLTLKVVVSLTLERPKGGIEANSLSLSMWWAQYVRSQKSQNESSPEFFDFSSRILPRISLRIFPEFYEDFSCFVSWRRRPEEIHQKSPPFFNAKFPGKHEKNIHIILLESRQSNNMYTYIYV